MIKDNNVRSLVNRKPYRTKAQKELARKTAIKCNDGTWRSDAPVSYHTKDRERREE